MHRGASGCPDFGNSVGLGWVPAHCPTTPHPGHLPCNPHLHLLLMVVDLPGCPHVHSTPPPRPLWGRTRTSAHPSQHSTASQDRNAPRLRTFLHKRQRHAQTHTDPQRHRDTEKLTQTLILTDHHSRDLHSQTTHRLSLTGLHSLSIPCTHPDSCPVPVRHLSLAEGIFSPGSVGGGWPGCPQAAPTPTPGTFCRRAWTVLAQPATSSGFAV